MRCKHCNRELREENGQLYNGTKKWNNGIYSQFCEKRIELEVSKRKHELNKEDNIKALLEQVDSMSQDASQTHSFDL